jgi:hypothetical protein
MQLSGRPNVELHRQPAGRRLLIPRDSAEFRSVARYSVRTRREHVFVMSTSDPLPSFDRTAPLGRALLLVGAFSPMLAILGLRLGLGTLGWIMVGSAFVSVAWWLWFLLRLVPQRQGFEITIVSAEPIDRDVTAYIASYLLPVLAAKPEHDSGYVAYGLAGLLILVVAYRADLGAINPLAYLCRYRAYRVTAADGVRIVLSRSLLLKDATWVMQDAAGIVVAASPSTELRSL